MVKRDGVRKGKMVGNYGEAMKMQKREATKRKKSKSR